MDTTSATLLSKLRSADDGSWSRFVHIYSPILYHWARDLGLQDADAVDLVQDVFTILVKKLPEFSYDRRKSFRGWLRTIAVNRWREAARRRRPAGHPGELELVPGPPAEWFGDQEFRAAVVQRVVALIRTDFQPETWRAFWEHVVGGRSAPDVAREFGTTPGAVYAAKVRILARLQTELADLMSE